jgi:HPt (histidine-containing phosphotransfer) domain-containing protein
MSEAFDEEALMERVDNDLEFLEETVSMLDDDWPNLLRQIQEAAIRSDTSAIIEPAHTLKGMLSNFCATPAEIAAREVEMMGRENRMINVEAAITLLESEVNNLRNALREFLEAAKR